MTAPRRSRWWVAAATATALLALAGCGTDDDPSHDPSDGSSTTEAGFTAPGSTLDFGDTATVPRTNGAGTFEITVTGVEAGDSADLAAIGYDGARDTTPYYVHYQVTLVDGDVQGFAMYQYLSAWEGDQPVPDLVYTGTFSPCQEKYFEVGADPGDSVTSCKVYVADKDTPPVDRVVFANDDRYDTTEDTQIEWR